MPGQPEAVRTSFRRVTSTLVKRLRCKERSKIFRRVERSGCSESNVLDTETRDRIRFQAVLCSAIGPADFERNAPADHRILMWKQENIDSWNFEWSST